MNSYGRGRALNNSDEDSDYGSSRYGRPQSRAYSSSNNGSQSARSNNHNDAYYPTSARSITRRDSFSKDEDNKASKKYGPYRNTKYDNEINSSDDDFKSSAKYGDRNKKVLRFDSDSEDDYDKKRVGPTNAVGMNRARPFSSAGRKEQDNYSEGSSYESAHVIILNFYDKIRGQKWTKSFDSANFNTFLNTVKTFFSLISKISMNEKVLS